MDCWAAPSGQGAPLEIQSSNNCFSESVSNLPLEGITSSCPFRRLMRLIISLFEGSPGTKIFPDSPPAKTNSFSSSLNSPSILAPLWHL